MVSLDEAVAEAVPDGAPLGRRLVHRRRLRRDIQLLGAHALPPLRKGIPGLQTSSVFSYNIVCHLMTLILFLDMGVFAKVQSPVVPLHPLAPAARVDIRPNRVSPSNVSAKKLFQ